ncbi:uncharacterized protein SETTUDRAFT_111377 [Exserohilum turcica Et28A]|uniref:Uncharacterized protein n=1 Tax=Exserohilum turcicum (strain 28A) TaxID=671987 RepID=R0K8C2_EXST2|nr:uncharacterized protein SETTUDRAFT_111377 [Exserohilum turcica Et28A]EOA85709.1 hypothetical protein SETTUDRAFT_111377 [Exserohilum turcica Et28A]
MSQFETPARSQEFDATAPHFLPDKLWITIIGFACVSAWKQLRLSCRDMKRLATPFLFQTVHFELTGEGYTSLLKIACNPVLAPYVQTIILRRRVALRNFDKFYEWERSICLPKSPSNRSMRKKCDRGLLSHSEWKSFPQGRRRFLHQQYMKDCKAIAEQLQSIPDRSLLLAMDDVQQKFSSPREATLLALAGSTPLYLHQAFAKFINLLDFRHEAVHADKAWVYQWRHLRFRPFADTRGGRNDDMEAFQLSIALRALGWASPSLPKLDILKFYASGIAFWTPARLYHLWTDAKHDTIRLCREEFMDEVEADQWAQFDLERRKIQLSPYLTQLSIMALPFTTLTELDCSVSEEFMMSAHAARTCLVRFLCYAKNLQRARIKFVNGAGDATKLLTSLTEIRPWPAITQITLEMCVETETLLRFLSTHTSTLRILSLSQVTTTKDWESTLHAIRQSIHLEMLTLSKLKDSAYQEERRPWEQRILFDPDSMVWRGRKEDYDVYYGTAIRQILGGKELCRLY